MPAPAFLGSMCLHRGASPPAGNGRGHDPFRNLFSAAHRVEPRRAGLRLSAPELLHDPRNTECRGLCRAAQLLRCSARASFGDGRSAPALRAAKRNIEKALKINLPDHDETV